MKKLSADAEALLTLLRRWQGEATKTGSTLNRIVVAFEAGRDGFWLARWLRTRGIGAYVIHPTSIPVSREHRRGKTDRIIMPGEASRISLLREAFCRTVFP